MSGNKEDLIKFRLERADKAFELAKIAIEKRFWNSAASELYYTCYYLISALFAKHDIKTSTHSGMKTMFGMKFIKGGNIDIRWAKLFNTLFDRRQEGDYGDFVILEEDEVKELSAEVMEFRILVQGILP